MCIQRLMPLTITYPLCSQVVSVQMYSLNFLLSGLGHQGRLCRVTVECIQELIKGAMVLSLSNWFIFVFWRKMWSWWSIALPFNTKRCFFPKTERCSRFMSFSAVWFASLHDLWWVYSCSSYQIVLFKLESLVLIVRAIHNYSSLILTTIWVDWYASTRQQVLLLFPFLLCRSYNLKAYLGW